MIIISPVSDKQKEYARKHQQEKLDRIVIQPEKGTKERWQREADSSGKSLTKWIVDIVEEFLQK